MRTFHNNKGMKPTRRYNSRKHVMSAYYRACTYWSNVTFNQSQLKLLQQMYNKMYEITVLEILE